MFLRGQCSKQNKKHLPMAVDLKCSGMVIYVIISEAREEMFTEEIEHV